SVQSLGINRRTKASLYNLWGDGESGESGESGSQGIGNRFLRLSLVGLEELRLGLRNHGRRGRWRHVGGGPLGTGHQEAWSWQRTGGGQRNWSRSRQWSHGHWTAVEHLGVIGSHWRERQRGGVRRGGGLQVQWRRLGLGHAQSRIAGAGGQGAQQAGGGGGGVGGGGGGHGAGGAVTHHLLVHMRASGMRGRRPGGDVVRRVAVLSVGRGMSRVAGHLHGLHLGHGHGRHSGGHHRDGGGEGG
ncbi:hypothetical protein M5D96_010960, partial [Drosophila gunungcola]